MKLIIDEREHDLFTKCSLLMQQTPYPNVSLSKEVLPLGDMIVRTNSDEDILIIERKTFADLLASIKDGRYEEQSYRLLHSSGFRQHSVIYLLEGMFSMLKYPNDKKIIYSAMTSLQFFKGFSTHRTATVQETAEWVLHMTEKIGKELLNGKQPYYAVVSQANEPSQGDGGGGAAQETPADYCSVVKKVKKENITPQNIGEIMLCQIPGISTATAVAIMKRFDGGFPHFLDNLQNNPDCLENIVMEMDNGKQRKISKSSVENIRRFLLSATPPPPPLEPSTLIHQEKEPCPP